jgi:hypothetical protein
LAATGGNIVSEQTEHSGVFDLPDGVLDPGYEDPGAVAIELDGAGHVTPTVTVPGAGDLDFSGKSAPPNPAGNGTTPFDPEHEPLDKAIFDANNPPPEYQLPVTPSDPLHLGKLPGEESLLDGPSTVLEPGDYPEPADDPGVADFDYGADDSAPPDVFG